MANKKASENLLAQERQRTSAKDWKSKVIGNDVEVPSGNIARIRRIGPEAFLSSGNIPDALAPIINEAIRDGQGLPPEKVTEMSSDPKQLAQMLEMIDRIVVMAVIEPACAPVPLCSVERDGNECLEGPLAMEHQDRKNSEWHVYVGQERSDDILYVDEIDIDDKNFIMQYAMGGSKDLERFRTEQAGSMEPVPNS